MTLYRSAPAMSPIDARRFNRLLAYAATHALEAAPSLLTANITRPLPHRPAPPGLDQGLRALLGGLIDSLAGDGRVGPAGLALAVRVFVATHPAPTPDQGACPRSADLWRDLLVAAADLDQHDQAPTLGDHGRIIVTEAVRDIIALTFQVISETMEAGGAVNRQRLGLMGAPADPAPTNAQLTYELIAIALSAIIAMGRSPDLARTIDLIADTLGYIEFASDAPLSPSLQGLARCGQSMTAEEETRRTVVWLDDDAPDRTTRLAACF